MKRNGCRTWFKEKSRYAPMSPSLWYVHKCKPAKWTKFHKRDPPLPAPKLHQLTTLPTLYFTSLKQSTGWIHFFEKFPYNLNPPNFSQNHAYNCVTAKIYISSTWPPLKIIIFLWVHIALVIANHIPFQTQLAFLLKPTRWKL